MYNILKFSTVGYKGTLSNLVLVGLTFVMGSYFLRPYMRGHDLVLPLQYLLLFSVLILLEGRSYANILSVEFGHITQEQARVWSWMRRTWFFGIMLLMALIWRTYFRITLLFFPLLGMVYARLGLVYSTVTWPLKLPYWLTFAWVVYREGLLVFRTLEPRIYPVSAMEEWLSRVVLTLLTTCFMGQLLVLSRGFIGHSKPLSLILRQNLPQLLIFFVFFYISIRWVDIITDMIDCRNKWQLALFWVTSFGMMVHSFIR